MCYAHLEFQKIFWGPIVPPNHAKTEEGEGNGMGNGRGERGGRGRIKERDNVSRPTFSVAPTPMLRKNSVVETVVHN